MDEPIAVVRKPPIQKATDRPPGPGELPAILMAVPLPAIDPDEIRLGTDLLECPSDPLTLGHIHIVVARPVHRQK